jgi:hypothetical protein
MCSEGRIRVYAKHKPLPVKTLRILLAVFILFIGHRVIGFELSIRKYEKAFLQVEHPEHTTRIDAFDLEVNYYPATYVDASIQFQSAFLVGEIRSYDGNWNALKIFYAKKKLEVSTSNSLPVWSLPLRIYRNDHRNGLDFPRDFSYDPFQADILQSLQDYYNPKKMSQRLGDAERSVYFVYVMADL